VGWRFEHEAARRVAILQVLEKPTVKFVNWAHVLSLQPGSIGGNVVHRGELIAHKGVAHDRNALLRKVSGDWMDFPEFRSQKMKAPSLRSARWTRPFCPNDGGGDGNITSQVVGAENVSWY